MPYHFIGHHHKNVRKRIYKKLEEFPHPNPWKKFLDRMLLLMAGVSPFLSFPQLIKIVSEESAQGVSLFAWILYSIFAIPWIYYGFLHKEKMLIYCYTGNFVMYASIGVAIFVYS